MGKVFTGMLITKKSTNAFRWDPNQQMGGDCHKMNDYLLRGPAVRREVYEDPKRDDRQEVDEMVDRPAYQR